MVYLDHLGNEFETLKDMCLYYGISKDTYRYRLKIGMDKEEALTKPLNYSVSKVSDHLGNIFNSKREMCRYWNITYDVFKYRIKKGCSIEEALSLDYNGGNVNSTVYDHLGNTFNSINDMLKNYGITLGAYTHRKKQNWSLEKILTTQVTHRCNKYTDHLGNVYTNYHEMCKKYNVAPQSYTKLLKKGFSVEEILTHRTEACYDHLGNEFRNVFKMCEYYGIEQATFTDRLENGYSLEEALTIKTGKLRGYRKNFYDHKNNGFYSKKEMAKYWGLSYSTLKGRLAKGMTLKDALETPVKEHEKLSYDHLGNKFGSQKEMCEFYNITPNMFTSRKMRGYSLEEILTGDIVTNKTFVDGVLGYSFKSNVEMTNFYCLPIHNYGHRLLTKGKDNYFYLCFSLETMDTRFKLNQKLNKNVKNIEKLYFGRNNLWYYNVEFLNGEKDIMTAFDIFMYSYTEVNDAIRDFLKENGGVENNEE